MEPYQRLALAVITQAIEDALLGRRVCSDGLALWCAAAGLPLEMVRDGLRRIQRGEVEAAPLLALRPGRRPARVAF